MAAATLFLSAGDPSGDKAASLLIRALKNLVSHLTVFGLGGGRLKRRGQEQRVEGRNLAVLGFWEVAKRYSFFHALIDRFVD